VKDKINISDRSLDTVVIADVAYVKTEPGIADLVPHVILFRFITTQNADLFRALG
jgi:hypothetical protein